jgi:hypothetical protein
MLVSVVRQQLEPFASGLLERNIVEYKHVEPLPARAEFFKEPVEKFRVDDIYMSGPIQS